MAVKSNGTTTVSKEKLSELVEHANIAGKEIQDNSENILRVYNSLKDSNELQGAELESVMVVVENVSKVAGDIAKKFALLVQRTNSMISFVEDASKQTKSSLEASKSSTAGLKVKVGSAGNAQ